jgi:Tol biopolymer transport system component
MSGLSQKQALEIGIQIAEGLAAAHEKGVVHRDIKPENIMVRKDGIAQIMDFGLAKLKGVSRLTKEGSTVGTAGYMSPEQVQGQDADHRSDIFSLGVLLYEMLTGQLPFKGVHETAIAYEIVNVDAAPMAAVRPEMDPSLDAIVLECLEKDPRERTQSASQVAVDLKRYRRESSRQRASRITASRPVSSASLHSRQAAEAQMQDRPTAGARRSLLIAVGATALLMFVAGYVVSRFTGSGEHSAQVIRASVTMPPGVRYADGVGGHSAISPDGSMIVFSGWDSLSKQRLWLRPLAEGDVRALSGTDNASYPFWSPDNRSIAFFAEGKLRVVSVAGGPVLALADAPFGRGGAWAPDGTIIFSASVTDRNLTAVASSGGPTRLVTAFDSTNSAAPRFPSFLPDGRRFMFSMLELEGGGNNADVYLGSLDNTELREIAKGVISPFYSSGYLLFLRQGILMVQPFDADAAELSGNPVALQANVNSWLARAKGDFSVSQTGLLLYAGRSTEQSDQFILIDLQGNEMPLEKARPMRTVSLSPDGKRIAYDEHDGQKADIWIYDIEKRIKSRLTFSAQGSLGPRWSSDGSRVYFNTEVGPSKANIFFKKADGAGKEELLAQGEPGNDVGYYPEAESPDGRFLLITISNESGSEFATLDLRAAERPLPVVKLGISGRDGRFSPDGRWIVYNSLETGGNNIFVSSFGGSQGKWQLPASEGSNPMWVDDRIIFFTPVTDRYETIHVAVDAGTPSFGAAEPLFLKGRPLRDYIYGVMKDQKGYLGLRRVDSGSSGHLSIIVNWKRLAGSE